MPGTRRIALIHATRVAIDPIEAAFHALWPAAETVTILEEGLSADLASGRVSQVQLDARIVALADYAMGLGPDGILYTCSSFGVGIAAAARRLPVPVLKPNEAMFDAAIQAGGRVAMLYSFPPAKPGMEQEFAAASAGMTMRSVFVPGALEALRSGDVAGHDELVAEAAAEIRDADAIMLAHFSMSRAADAARARTAVPVLTSPETAIRRMQEMLGSLPC
ncbi:MAG: arylsulfatase [Paracoccus denitrificans]|uniref:Arylsulfatase n=1 Tax=Paracoccus denitrificans TaxID=266 RepID=A0A533I1Q9_PARDE|nr:MAG: arylsulfatase [Paracoccus denitrificans]